MILDKIVSTNIMMSQSSPHKRVLITFFFLFALLLVLWINSSSAAATNTFSDQRHDGHETLQSTFVSGSHTPNILLSAATMQGWRPYQEDRYDIRNGVVIHHDVCQDL